jgi:MFS transporter, FSR family, fosmidomycin resistance protein
MIGVQMASPTKLEVDSSATANRAPSTHSGPRAHVPLLALLTIAHVVVDTYATAVPALLPFWQERFALSYGLAGLITGIANVTSSVAQPLIGVLIDRGRDPRWIAVACLVAAAGVSASGLAPNFAIFLGLVVVGGLGVSAFHPQGYKLTGLYGGQRQAAATSWFLVGGNVGVALGPLLGTAFVVRFGLPGTTLFMVPGLVLAGAMVWLVPRWTGVRWRRGRQLEQPSEVRRAGQQEAIAVNPRIAALGRRRRAMALSVLVILVALRATVSSSLVSFVPLYYVRVVGVAETAASQVLAVMLLTGAVATLAGGYLADRWGRQRVLALSLLAVPPCLLVFLLTTPGGPVSTAALWAAGALVTGSFAITVVLAQELWFERRALASGVIVGFAFGMGGLLVPLIGIVADLWGLPAAFYVVAALPVLPLALTGVLAWLMKPAPGR